ncbi:MAG: hypothetical protein AB1424_05120 [Thermodesulfobacteriota bacterium]
MKKVAEKATKDKRLVVKKNCPTQCEEGTMPESSPNTHGKFLGTTDIELQLQFMGQCWGALGVTTEQIKKGMEKIFEHIHAAVGGINPENELEGMLAVQMFSAHVMSMEFSRRAMHPQQHSEGVDANVARASQFMKVFLEQVACLQKLKGKASQQKVTVEHVHVHQGGQAIVGTVTPRGEG